MDGAAGAKVARERPGGGLVAVYGGRQSGSDNEKGHKLISLFMGFDSFDVMISKNKICSMKRISESPSLFLGQPPPLPGAKHRAQNTKHKTPKKWFQTN